MADPKTKDAAAAAALPKRYRNRTKVDQTFYLPTGESIRVVVGGTVILDDKTAQKYLLYLELVNNEDGSPVEGGTEQ